MQSKTHLEKTCFDPAEASGLELPDPIVSGHGHVKVSVTGTVTPHSFSSRQQTQWEQHFEISLGPFVFRVCLRLKSNSEFCRGLPGSRGLSHLPTGQSSLFYGVPSFYILFDRYSQVKSILFWTAISNWIDLYPRLHANSHGRATSLRRCARNRQTVSVPECDLINPSGVCFFSSAESSPLLSFYPPSLKVLFFESCS